MDALDHLKVRWLPLALHESLDVGAAKEGKDGQPVHIEMADCDAGLKAVDKVLKFQEWSATW